MLVGAADAREVDAHDTVCVISRALRWECSHYGLDRSGVVHLEPVTRVEGSKRDARAAGGKVVGLDLAHAQNAVAVLLKKVDADGETCAVQGDHGELAAAELVSLADEPVRQGVILLLQGRPVQARPAEMDTGRVREGSWPVGPR